MKKINIIYECSALNDPSDPLFSIICRVLNRTNSLNTFIEEVISLMTYDKTYILNVMPQSINMLLDKHNEFIAIESIKLKYDDVNALLSYLILIMSYYPEDYYHMISFSSIKVNYKDASIMITGDYAL